MRLSRRQFARGRAAAPHERRQAGYWTGDVEENVEVVRGSLERFAAGEIAWETLDEEVEIHDHDILDAGEYRGHEGVLRWIEDWSSGLPQGLRAAGLAG